MLPVALVGGLCLGALALVVMWLVRYLRSQNLVSPILLDEALDPDLRRARRDVLAQRDAPAPVRREVCRLIIAIAAGRQAGRPTADDELALEQLWRQLRGETEKSPLDPRPQHG